MELREIDYAVSNTLYERVKEKLMDAAILQVQEDDGLERFLMPGARIRIDVPVMQDNSETILKMIYEKTPLFSGFSDLPWFIPKYIKEILRYGRVD